nr:uncharacterized protein LOC105868446 [Microcebus murinus]
MFGQWQTRSPQIYHEAGSAIMADPNMTRTRAYKDNLQVPGAEQGALPASWVRDDCASLAILATFLSHTLLRFMGEIMWQSLIRGSVRAVMYPWRMSRAYCTSVTMETSSRVATGLSSPHDGAVPMDSRSGNGQGAGPGDRATPTPGTCHTLQDVSRVSSQPGHPAAAWPGVLQLRGGGEGEPVRPGKIWNHASAPGTASRPSLPGSLPHGQSSQGGHQLIIDFQGMMKPRLREAHQLAQSRRLTHSWSLNSGPCDSALRSLRAPCCLSLSASNRAGAFRSLLNAFSHHHTWFLQTCRASRYKSCRWKLALVAKARRKHPLMLGGRQWPWEPWWLLWQRASECQQGHREGRGRVGVDHGPDATHKELPQDFCLVHLPAGSQLTTCEDHTGQEAVLWGDLVASGPT